MSFRNTTTYTHHIEGASLIDEFITRLDYSNDKNFFERSISLIDK